MTAVCPQRVKQTDSEALGAPPIVASLMPGLAWPGMGMGLGEMRRDGVWGGIGCDVMMWDGIRRKRTGTYEIGLDALGWGGRTGWHGM